MLPRELWGLIVSYTADDPACYVCLKIAGGIVAQVLPPRAGLVFLKRQMVEEPNCYRSNNKIQVQKNSERYVNNFGGMIHSYPRYKDNTDLDVINNFAYTMHDSEYIACPWSLYKKLADCYYYVAFLKPSWFYATSRTMKRYSN